MSAPLAALCGLWKGSPLLQRILEEGACAVPDVARAFTVAGLSAESSPLLIVLPRSRDAEAFADELRQYLTSSDVALYPAWEVLPGEAMSPTLATMGMRIRVIRDLRAGAGARVIVTSIRALLQKVGPGSIESITLAVGGSWSLDLLAEKLTGFGYERNYLVERPGEFSIRGGILDVFPADGAEPVRADMFGDEIAELRSFGVSSQRSREPVESVEILPCRELLLTDEVREKAAALAERANDSNASSALSKISSGVVFPGMEAYLPMVSDELVTICSLLPSVGTVVILDPKQARDRAADFLSQATQWGGAAAAGHFVEFDEAISSVSVVEVWPYARGDEDPQVVVTGWDGFLGRVDELAQELQREHASGASLVVAAGKSSPRAREVLAQGGLGLAEGSAAIGKAMLTSAHVMRGFKMDQDGLRLVLVGESDLFGKRRPVVASRAETPARASALLLELASEDYVVHETYGVGRYHGMVTRDIGGVTRDYLIIEYHGDDRLYLPTEQLEAITRYTGGETPRLNRLGTAEWEKAKGRARKAVADIAGELIVLYSKRLNSPGHAFALDTPWQRELEDSFIHIETPDQSRTIDEVKADMERPIPMDRLVCGDVGYGKTEIAVRAAFKAVQDSKQVAVLVPTTILAQQHTQTFTERFAGFPLKVQQLSRFLTQAEQGVVIEDMASGRADVVIGTHRLIQADVKFHDLGLLVVDEEQRFGVKDKEKIKHLRAHVDVLTLSATPIPRTLEMGITGIRDLSVIDTAPVERRPVLTYVGESDDHMVTTAIRRELARDGQVFYVHNRVRSIRGVARKIAGLVPGARVEVAHGQMSESELEKVMVQVWEGKVDVLVCTTIIESGLDIPAMNTLVVERADLLGLSQLYQLRGRVGRARERAYAYFLYPHEAILTDEAHERLKTLSEFTELGSGFKIALRDLEIRGAGNLLGAEQSGHIAAVGFDLYIKMMTEAVAKLTGAEHGAPLELKLDLPADAFIPASYIARESLRMEAYRQIEKIRSPEDAASLAEEFEDRYGPLSPPVRNLLGVAELRAFLADQGVKEASVRDGILKLRPFPLLSDSQEVRLRRKFPDATYKQLAETLLLPVPAKDLVAWVMDSLRAILA